MSIWTESDNLRFNTGRFQLLTQAAHVRVPRPRPASPGGWIHLPYGGNKHETDGTLLHTVWTPQGGILIVDDANYDLIEQKYQQFSTLVTPWGTFSAKLADLSVSRFPDSSWRGTAVWEWA